MKLTPPAKSVSLSIWNVAAIVKKMSCMPTVTMALTARWSTSKMSTAMARAAQRIAPRFLSMLFNRFSRDRIEMFGWFYARKCKMIISIWNFPVHRSCGSNNDWNDCFVCSKCILGFICLEQYLIRSGLGVWIQILQNCFFNSTISLKILSSFPT